MVTNHIIICVKAQRSSEINSHHAFSFCSKTPCQSRFEGVRFSGPLLSRREAICNEYHHLVINLIKQPALCDGYMALERLILVPYARPMYNFESSTVSTDFRAIKSSWKDEFAVGHIGTTLHLFSIESRS